MINHFTITGSDKKNWYIVDLPGYGFAKVSQNQRKSWQKMIQDYIRKRENLVNLFALVDSRHEPQKADLDFIINWANGGYRLLLCLPKPIKPPSGKPLKMWIIF
jgi:GTP-binding protein